MPRWSLLLATGGLAAILPRLVFNPYTVFFSRYAVATASYWSRFAAVAYLAVPIWATVEGVRAGRESGRRFLGVAVSVAVGALLSCGFRLDARDWRIFTIASASTLLYAATCYLWVRAMVMSSASKSRAVLLSTVLFVTWMAGVQLVAEAEINVRYGVEPNPLDQAWNSFVARAEADPVIATTMRLSPATAFLQLGSSWARTMPSWSAGFYVALHFVAAALAMCVARWRRAAYG